MKPFGIILLISFFIWSCSNNKPNNNISNQEGNKEMVDKIEGDTFLSLKKVELEKVKSEPETISNEPCVEIKEFVADIEKLKWIPDNNRLRKVGIYSELDIDNVTYFDDRPFYPIKFEDSRLNSAYNAGMYKSHFDSLDFELFKGVQNIWGYFYRDRDASDWISDGVIEQWEFKNVEQAKRALKQIIQPGFIIYFNTNPYFCRLENKLIIFQSRAMAFSYDQKPIFEKFVKEKAPSIMYE